MDSKPYVKLAKDTAFIGYRVQQGLYTILRKTYKKCLSDYVQSAKVMNLVSETVFLFITWSSIG